MPGISEHVRHMTGLGRYVSDVDLAHATETLAGITNWVLCLAFAILEGM